jgi:SAP domain-containing new25/Domain of unknown function (DUF6434)
VTEQRPPLNSDISGTELLRWYWLKDELAGLARQLGVGAGGGKQELSARLVAALDGKPVPAAEPARRGSARGMLAGLLTSETVMPAGQRCSQELRQFFTDQIGPGFHFDASMREFITLGEGRTLGDAIQYWHRTRSQPSADIAPQFELNLFMRDWHAGHPGGTRSEALRAWKQYRSLPVDSRPGPA